MSGYDLDKYFPLQGTCFHCGRDLRHKTLDTIIERFSFGEPITKLADEFCVPAQAIELVISRNSTGPLGTAVMPKMLARAA